MSNLPGFVAAHESAYGTYRTSLRFGRQVLPHPLDPKEIKIQSAFKQRIDVASFSIADSKPARRLTVRKVPQLRTLAEREERRRKRNQR
jgi:hypothetical protein